MRAVVISGPGQVELNYMWLPTWIGMNQALIKELEAAIAPKFIGVPLTERTLDEMHGAILHFLRMKFGTIEGLWDYVDGLKFVQDLQGSTHYVNNGRLVKVVDANERGPAESSGGEEPGVGHQGVRETYRNDDH